MCVWLCGRAGITIAHVQQHVWLIVRNEIYSIGHYMHHLEAIYLDIFTDLRVSGKQPSINNVSLTICQGKEGYKLTSANYLLDIITCNY